MEPAVPRHGKQPHRVQHQEEGAESARGKQRPRALKPGWGHGLLVCRPGMPSHAASAGDDKRPGQL